MTANRSFIIFVISISAMYGCNAETNNIDPKTPSDTLVYIAPATNSASAEPIKSDNCRAVNDALANLPSDVLVGTDIESITNFVTEDFVAGNYYTDNGGATITVSLRETKNAFTAQRSYREPGLKEDSKVFTNLCIESDMLYGESLRIRFVEGGLLWLEMAPDNDFIPAELWIYLEQSN